MRCKNAVTDTQRDFGAAATDGRWFKAVATAPNYRNSNAAESPKYDEVETPTATYTVDAGAFPADSGTITGTGTYSAGSSVTLTATPKEGYRFVAWRDLANPTLSTDATYTFTVNEDTVLLAMFEEVETPTEYNITVTGGIISIQLKTAQGSNHIPASLLIWHIASIP